MAWYEYNFNIRRTGKTSLKPLCRRPASPRRYSPGDGAQRGANQSIRCNCGGFAGHDLRRQRPDAVAGIIRIDAATRQQTLLAQGGFLHNPTGITTDGKRTAYVVDGTGRSLVAVDL